IQTFTRRYARPAQDKLDLSCLASAAHLAVIERVLKGADPAMTAAGHDPTEIMERIALERAGRA
ncbi:MAG: hypothetical protein ABJB05_16950, partial [Parafilimonas sp.]